MPVWLPRSRKQMDLRNTATSSRNSSQRPCVKNRGSNDLALAGTGPHVRPPQINKDMCRSFVCWRKGNGGEGYQGCQRTRGGTRGQAEEGQGVPGRGGAKCMRFTTRNLEMATRGRVPSDKVRNRQIWRSECMVWNCAKSIGFAFFRS